MRKIKITFNIATKEFTVDEAEMRHAVPEMVPHIISLVYELNTIPLKDKVSKANWVWIIFLMYLISFFLIFVAWYLVFIPILFFIIFICVMTYMNKLWQQFKMAIECVCMPFVATLANFYDIENKFIKSSSRIKAHHMMLVLIPAESAAPRRSRASKIQVAPQEPIPIFAFNPYQQESVPQPDQNATNSGQPGRFSQRQNFGYQQQAMPPNTYSLNQVHNIYSPNVYQVPRVEYADSLDLEALESAPIGFTKQK
jgi:hypothetical protein